MMERTQSPEGPRLVARFLDEGGQSMGAAFQRRGVIMVVVVDTRST